MQQQRLNQQRQYHCLPLSTATGFPEHVSQTKQALARGYSVLALDPNDARHLCWSSASRGTWVNDQTDVSTRGGWAGWAGMLGKRAGSSRSGAEWGRSNTAQAWA